jgi:hypothetical protein
MNAGASVAWPAFVWICPERRATLSAQSLQEIRAAVSSILHREIPQPRELARERAIKESAVERDRAGLPS